MFSKVTQFVTKTKQKLTPLPEITSQQPELLQNIAPPFVKMPLTQIWWYYSQIRPISFPTAKHPTIYYVVHLRIYVFISQAGNKFTLRMRACTAAGTVTLLFRGPGHHPPPITVMQARIVLPWKSAVRVALLASLISFPHRRIFLHAVAACRNAQHRHCLHYKIHGRVAPSVPFV